MAAILFPSVGLQLFSALIHFMGVTMLSHCLSRRLATIDFSFAGILELSWSRLCLLLIFLDSWLFLFSSGVLIFGVGLELNHRVCSAAIYLCIAFYATSKILTYFFLIERVHVVWAPATGISRFKAPVDRLCFVTVSPYTAVIALMLVGRISAFREGDQACIIGLKPLSSIPLLSYDLYINVLLTGLFLWPLLKTGHLSQRVKTMAIRALVASIAALTTSTFNIAILAILHGQELGWVCLGSCGADVIVNSLALYWATYPRTQRQRPVTISSGVGSKDVGPTAAGGISIAARASSPFIIPPQAVRSRNDLERQGRDSDPYTNPFALPQYIPKEPQPEVRVTAQPHASTDDTPRGIWNLLSRLVRKKPVADEEGHRRRLEVSMVDDHYISHYTF
uniref:Transmembrane protein n=1 Tax=Moniliophthora roreri TaxID=221103 RepID=A0A0W0EUV2_MONRR